VATQPTYISVEACAQAFDVHATAYQTPNLWRVAQAASRTVQKACDRRFYPTVAERIWRAPTRSGRLWVPDDLLEVTALEFDGVAVTGYTLQPSFFGAPYTWIDLVDATNSSAAGTVVTIEGVWGFSDDSEPAGALASSPNASTTSVTVTDSSLVGTGDLIQVDDERMVVTGKGLADTGTTLTGNPTASASDTAVAVASGAAVAAGETVTVDSERMTVLSVSGNTLTVRRAVDGTVLAAHTSSTVVYAPRALTVERAAAGTTAASHSAPAAVTRNAPPAPIVEWALAEALTMFGQEKAGWNLQVGEGDNATESTGQQIAQLRRKTLDNYRRHHHGAI
jgi:hypothetical protein